MAMISKTFKHTLGQKEAVRRIRERISSERVNKANIANVTKEIWNDNNNLEFSMTVFNYRVDGSLSIEEELVTLNLRLPMGAMVFKGMIENQISQQMSIMLS